jgi:hypothetical protein
VVSRRRRSSAVAAIASSEAAAGSGTAAVPVRVEPSNGSPASVITALLNVGVLRMVRGLQAGGDAHIYSDLDVFRSVRRLLAMIGGSLGFSAFTYDALIVRSGAKVTAKVLENPGKLKAIARAGVGVDNIDLEAATAKGILVLNTAEASTLSTAEHALALMMSLARKIPAGQCQCSGATGMEKTQRNIRARNWPAKRWASSAWAASAAPSPPRAGDGNERRRLRSVLQPPTALDGKVKLIRDFDEFLGRST